MSNPSQSPIDKLDNPWINYGLGIILMVGGTWFSANVHLDALQKLEEQGISIDPGKTIATIGVFLILFKVLHLFFFGPLGKAIHDRNSELERTFTDAENLRSEMQTMRADYEKRLATTEATAREQIQTQIKEAQQLRQVLMAEATSKADQLVEKATEEIAAERDRILVELRTHVVDLTLQAAGKVIDANLDDAKNRKLVEDFTNQLEVAK